MKIDHLGIAVKNLKKTITFYQEMLGLEKLGEEIVAEQGVKVAFFKVGESKVELLEPLDEQSPIARHIEKRGQGIHHMALQVTELESRVEEMKAQGVNFIGEKPTSGAEGKKIIFVHPKSTDGVLMELCELTEEDNDDCQE